MMWCWMMYIYLSEIIGYNDNKIIGYDIEHNIVRINMTDSSTECYQKYEYKGKRYELQLCGYNCFCQCHNI